MRVLGIDYGTKRIGVAIGDTDTKMAVPFAVVEELGIRNPSNSAGRQELEIARIARIVKDEDVELIVVGMPTNVDGSQSEVGMKVDKFVRELKNKIKVEIKIQDERFSTKQIEQVTKEYGYAKKGIDKDSAAAALILQGWLDSHDR